MSLLAHEALDLESVRADFDGFLALRKWSDANVIIENLFDSGFKLESITLNKALIAARMNINVRENHEPKDPWEVAEERGMDIDNHRDQESHKEVW